MLPTSFFDFTLWASVIEFIGGLLIVGYILAAIRALISGQGIIHARLLVADGVLAALNFKLAGTLLKAIVVHSWQQILMFAAIFVLRTVLKRFFTWERTYLQKAHP